MGGAVGHCLCTGLAVIGGRMVAQKISVRTGESLSLILTFRITEDRKSLSFEADSVFVKIISDMDCFPDRWRLRKYNIM